MGRREVDARLDDGCAGLRGRLTQWRGTHGGRGVRLPEELWAEAVGLAKARGVMATARACGVDRYQLAKRVQRDEGVSPTARSGVRPARSVAQHGEFIEVALDASFGTRAGAARTVLAFEGRDGQRLRVELSHGMTTEELLRLCGTVWSGGR